MALKKGNGSLATANSTKKWLVLLVLTAAVCSVAVSVQVIKAKRMDRMIDAYNVPKKFPTPATQPFIAEVLRGHVGTALALATTIPDGVNVIGERGETALMIAVNRLDLPMVKALLAAGANPNGAPDHAPLHVAVRGYDLSVARALLAGGADPNGRIGSKTALHEAALLGYIEAADLLLKAGAQVDQPADLGVTPAMTAALSDNLPMVKFLLDHGASIWATSNTGMTIGAIIVNPAIHSDNEKIRQDIIAQLKAAQYPWPPPTVREVSKLMDEGKWPPPHP